MADGIDWIKWYVIRWRSSARRLEMSDLHRLAYLELLFHQADIGYIPDSEAAIVRSTLLAPGTITRFMERWGTECFPMGNDGKRRNDEMLQIRNEAVAMIASNRKAGIQSGLARQGSKCSTDVPSLVQQVVEQCASDLIFSDSSSLVLGDARGETSPAAIAAAEPTPAATVCPQTTPDDQTPPETPPPGERSTGHRRASGGQGALPSPRTPSRAPIVTLDDVAMPAPLDTPACIDALDRWVAYKWERGETYRATGLNALLSKWAKVGAERTIAAVSHSMSCNYAGIYEEKSNGRSRETGTSSRLAAPAGKYDRFTPRADDEAQPVGGQPGGGLP
jgi:hypothetical protein